MMPRKIMLVLLTGILAISSREVPAGGNIYGVARMERIKGQPQMGYREMYEWSLFLTPAHPTIDGISRRIGTSEWIGGSCLDNSTNRGENYCKSDLYPAIYSGLLTQPYKYATPKVVNNISILEGQTTRVDFEMPIDYSTYYVDSWTYAAPSWCQTFVATGHGIRGVNFCHANDNTPEGVTVTILSEKPGVVDPALWTPIASATRLNTKKDADNWVRWRTGQVPTIPGQRYAVKLTGNNGALQPFRRYKDGNSYTGGRAYLAGWPQSFDLNIIVFSDNDGTSVTMNSSDTDRKVPDSSLAREAYGQTFKAHGNSLAAADCFLSSDTYWNDVLEWKVREGGPTGPQVGVTRRVRGAHEGTSIHGVSFNPGEVPLIAGQTYFIEIRLPYGGVVNPCCMKNDRYDDGIAYRLTGSSWGALASDDLHMTVVEYMPQSSFLKIQPTSFSHIVDKDSNQAPDTFTITNIGNETICYTVTEDASWLSVNQASGCVTPGASQPITITYALHGLSNGHYQGSITIQDPDSIPQSVIVSIDIVTAPGDFDEDHDVDQDDFGILQACLSGAGIAQDDPGCHVARLDSDEDVDQDDLAIFQACFSGPDTRAERDCAGRY